MEIMKNGLKIDRIGTRRYYLNDLLHCVDGPAREFVNGDKYWYLHGKQHRIDGPAIERAHGYKAWYLHGKRHRIDGPAEEWADGGIFWYLHDKIHRVDGPAVELANGTKRWFLHGKELIQPKGYKTMEAWFKKLNTNEEYSLQWINNINGIIEVIKNPTDKQKRLNAMKWKI